MIPKIKIKISLMRIVSLVLLLGLRTQADLCLDSGCPAGEVTYMQRGNGVCSVLCNSVICQYDAGDCITRDQPLDVYVAANTQVYSTDYISLSTALSELWTPYSTVYLRDGTHPLLQFNSISSIAIPGEVIIRTLLCSESNVFGCANQYATIQLSRDLVTLQVLTNLAFVNVLITGHFSLKDGCECVYCPAIHYNSSVWLNDRNEVINLNSIATTCQQYSTSVLIEVQSNATLILMNVTFSDITHQLKSLIESQCGGITLSNVTFHNIISSEVEGSAVIRLSGFQCGSLQYTGGTVELLNNGFELSVNWTFGGFLFAIGTQSVNITDVTFQYNALSATLLNISQANQVAILGSEFQNNLADVSLISIECQNADFEFVELNGNYAGQTMITLICLAACEINNYSSQGNTAVLALLSVQSPSNTVNVANTLFKRNSASYMSLVTNSRNVTLTNATFDGNGEHSAPFYNYLNSSYTYAKFTPSLPSISCSAIASISSVSLVTVNLSLFQGSICANGWAGLSTSNISSQIILDRTTFNSNMGFSVLRLGASASLSSLTFSNNSNLRSNDAACISVHSPLQVDIAISNSSFTGNQAIRNTVLLAQGIRSLTLTNTVISSNSALTLCAGIAFERNKDAETNFMCDNCTFSSNTANASGVLTILRNEQFALSSQHPIHFSVSNAVFINNTSSLEGSSLTTLGFAYLNGVITNTVFSNNSCTEGGAGAYLQLGSGYFHLNDSLFANNSGQAGAAIYYNNRNKNASMNFLQLSRCTFTVNYGQYIVMTQAIESSTLLSDSCVFQSNFGSSVSIVRGSWLDSNSVYLQNTADEGAGVKLISSNAQLINNSFISNTASMKGGAMLVTQSSNLTCTNCTFVSNICAQYGGALYADEGSAITGKYLLFIKNFAKGVGSALYMFRASGYIDYSNFTQNSVGTYGTIYLSRSDLILTHFDISANTATARTPGIMGTFGTLSIQDSTLHDQIGASGGCGFFVDQSVIVMQRVVMRNCTANSGGALVVIALSSIAITDSLMVNCSATTDGGLLVSRISTVVLARVSIVNIKSSLYYGAIYVLQATITVTDSIFANLTGSGMYLMISTVSVSNSSFSNIYSYRGAGVNCAECVVLNVTNSDFSTGQVVREGGAITGFSSGIILNPESFLIGNTFRDNSAGTGGALSFDNQILSLIQNSFINNSAIAISNQSKSGRGGGVITVCPTFNNCNFKLTNNTFINNSATLYGGAYIWQDRYPLLANNTMLYNSASYGSDIASLPVRLAVLDSQNSISQYLSNTDIPLVQEFDSIASGQSNGIKLKLALVDHYNHIVTSDSVSSAGVLVPNNSDISVVGMTELIAINGTFQFTDLIFSGEPGSTQTIEVVTNGIDTSLKALHRDPTTFYPTVSITLQFRECIAGENLQSQECYPCPSGTFSLDPHEVCETCPNHAICYGTNMMVPVPGYWRPDPNLNLFIECLNKDACLGSPDLNALTLTGLCALGYHGNLCGSCDSDYSGDDFGVCSKCPSPGVNIILCLLMGVFALGVVLVLIFISIRNANQPRSEFAIYVKILMNYLQMIVVAASLKIDWPNYISTFLHGQQLAGNASNQLMSIECLLKQNFTQTVFYTNVVVIIATPGLLLLGSALIWGIVQLIRKSANVISKIIASAVLIVFLLHTTITKAVFSLFSCKELLPGQYWINRDLSLRCWNSEHTQKIATLAIPGLCIWIVGLPTLCLFALYRKRESLKDATTRIQMSFLYKGYKPELFFWEFVILYRKIIIVCAAVFLDTVSITVQGLTMMGVILICIYLQMHYQPFYVSSLNVLEMKALCASLFTLFVGLYYQAGPNSKCYLDSVLGVCLFVMLLSANAVFALGWVKSVGPIIVEAIRKVLARLRNNKQLVPHFAVSNLSSTPERTPHSVEVSVRPDSEVPPNSSLFIEESSDVAGYSQHISIK